MRNLVRTVLAAAAVVLSTSASAQGAAHTHDGFFLRPELGVGYLHSGASQAGNDFSMYGGAGDFSLAIGGALQENLILAGHVYGTTAENPDVKLNGATASTSDTTNSLVGIGPQLTYYLMPANVYLSGTLALTRVTSKTNGVEGKTDVGMGLRLAVGKEWWVSENWGLGIAGNLGYSSNKDQGEGAARVGTWMTAVTFSATYN